MASSPADRERTASPRAFAIQELIACWDQGYEALTRGDLARVSSLLEFADELLETAADPRRDTPEESELRQRALVAKGRLEHGMRNGLAGLERELAGARRGAKALRGYADPARSLGTNLERRA